MCVETIAAIATAGSALLGLTKKAPKPPPTPAIQAAPANDTNATVRNSAEEVVDDNAPSYVGFTPSRKSAKTLGGLGQSGLAL